VEPKRHLSGYQLLGEALCIAEKEPTMTAPLDRKPDHADHDAARRHHEDSELDEALLDSFPASDPPALVQPTPTPEADDNNNKNRSKSRRRSRLVGVPE